MGRVTGWAVICMLLLFATPTMVKAADSACGKDANCAAPLDESNPGDNQSGDAGADREPPDSKSKG